MKALMTAACLVFVLSGTVLAQSGLHVYDSTGKVLGTWLQSYVCINSSLGCGSVAILSGSGISVVLPVSASGFVFSLGYSFNTPRFYHASSDCSGARFVSFAAADIGGFLPPPAILAAGKLIIPLSTINLASMHSVEAFNNPPANGDYTQPGDCTVTSTLNEAMYPVVTVNASQLGTPPFSVR
jgi:hypothetical protein